jgi:hypothetical protein
LQKNEKKNQAFSYKILFYFCLCYFELFGSTLKISTYFFQNCGSQESIIQLDLDDDDESDTGGLERRRRYSVSPMPQIRSSESQVGRSIKFHFAIYEFWFPSIFFLLSPLDIGSFIT